MNQAPAMNPMQEMMKKQGEELHRLNNLNAALEAERDKFEAALSKIVELTDLAQIVGVAAHALNRKEKARRSLNDRIIQHIDKIKAGLTKNDEQVLKIVGLHQAHLRDPNDENIIRDCEQSLQAWLNA